jgi:hypothetical protein
MPDLKPQLSGTIIVFLLSAADKLCCARVRVRACACVRVCVRACVQNNKSRVSKSIQTANPEGEKIRLFACETDLSEAEVIAK